MIKLSGPNIKMYTSPSFTWSSNNYYYINHNLGAIPDFIEIRGAGSSQNYAVNPKNYLEGTGAGWSAGASNSNILNTAYVFPHTQTWGMNSNVYVKIYVLGGEHRSS